MAVSVGITGHHNIFIIIFGILGNLISGAVFIAPIPSFYQIYKKQSSNGFHSTPYIVSLFSCQLWLYYAIITTNQPFLVSINSAGAVIESLYIVMFLFFSSKPTKVRTAKFFGFLNLAVFSTVVLTIQLIPTTFRREVLGYICDIATIAVFGGPLTILVNVIKSKDVRFMPFSLSISLTISSVIWFVYGVFYIDEFIMIPNVLGFLMGLVQMIVFGVIQTFFSAATRSEDPENPENRETIAE